MRLLHAAALSTGATLISAGLIIGPQDAVPAAGDYIRLQPGQEPGKLRFDPAQLYNDTFLAQLLDKHHMASLAPITPAVAAAATSSKGRRWTLWSGRRQPASAAGSAGHGVAPPPPRRTHARPPGGGHAATVAQPSLSYLAPRASEFVCNGVGPGVWASQAGVGRCAGLLLGLGNATCKTGPGEPVVLCDVREGGVRTVLRGLTLSGMDQSAKCQDCANGVEWVARNCGRAERCAARKWFDYEPAQDGSVAKVEKAGQVCYLGGAGATSGNGNFIMYLYGDGAGV